MKIKTIVLLLVVLVLTAIVLASRSLSILSTALLIGAGACAFLYRNEATDTRKLPWQTWLLTGLSVVLYLIDWLVLGN